MWDPRVDFCPPNMVLRLIRRTGKDHYDLVLEHEAIALRKNSHHGMEVMRSDGTWTDLGLSDTEGERWHLTHIDEDQP